MSKSNWIQKYRESTELVESSAGVLTGFNANLDVIHQVSDLDCDFSEIEPKLVENLSNIEELKSCLKYCMINSENHELDKNNLEIDFKGDKFIGGQAGIMSNFLAKTGNGVIFYTPLLSEDLSSRIDDKVLYPVVDGDFQLKNVQDVSNTDRTKKNHIFEFQTDETTGRMILSDSLKGFGPYFRKGIEQNLDKIEQNIDCAVFSGFHNIKGNKEAKLKKSAKQLKMIEKPIHLEFVDKNIETTSLILKYILPEVDSFGLDETEFSNLMELLDLGKPKDDLKLETAFEAAKKMIDRFGIDRIHLHTYRYHMVIVEKDYTNSVQNIKDSMLYGEVAAIQAADTGHIPTRKDIESFNMNEKEINGLSELREFADRFDINGFEKSGKANLDNFKVIAIPTIIHNNPEKTVGMGDIISSGAFSSEFS